MNLNVSNSSNAGNFANCYNEYNTFISDGERQVLQWLSPLASWERHQAVRDSRAEEVGDWLLRTQSFSTWRTLENRAAKPVLFCYGDPGVGKTYIRYEPP